MEVYGTFINLFLCIWNSFCIDISNTLEKGINITVCAGDEASLFFQIMYPSDVFFVLVKKEEIKNEQTPYKIGTYSPEKGEFVDDQFKKRYSIIPEKSGTILKINDTKEWDQGRFVCEVTYDGKPDVTKEQHLIVKEKENSSLITFKERKNSSCMIVTCSADSRILKLKRPNNEIIKGSHHELNSCNGFFVDGKYSCCLVTNCSEEICKHLTLEWKYPMNFWKWFKEVFIGCFILLIAVVFLGYFYKFRETQCRSEKIIDVISCKKNTTNESGVTSNKIRIMFIGKTYTGKTSTTNTLAGTNLFHSTAGVLDNMEKCKLETLSRFDKNFVLVDTPGLFKNCMSNEKVTKEIAKGLEMIAPGPHAFLLVVSIGRFTKEDSETVKYFVELFGEDFLKYLIVVFTRMDDLDFENTTFKEYVENAHNDLKHILHLCEKRYVGFNNKLEGEENNGQIQSLLEKIDSMIEANDNQWYSIEMYKEAKKALLLKNMELRPLIR